MSDGATQLYQRWVNQRSRDDRWLGALPGATRESSLTNPLCGDSVVVRLHCDGDRIAVVRTEVRGCAICKASASLLGERLEQLSLEGAGREVGRALAAMRGTEDPSPVDPLADLLGVRSLRTRIRCATLPWEAAAHSLATKDPA